MRYDYLEQLKYLNSLNLTDNFGRKIEFFDAFYGTGNEFLFEVPFQFYQEYINREEKKYGFTPTLIAFINNSNINAFASKSISLIGINAGTIIEMEKLFFGIDYGILIKGELENFDILGNVGQEGFLEKLYRYCQMFTFFHELGHIIQDDLKGYSHFSEMVDCGFYSKEAHLMEYDADQFAAIMISVHINDFMEKIHGKNKKLYYNKKIAEMLLSTAMSAIFVNYLIFQSNKSDFYTESCSHPHPTLRVTYILNTVVDAFGRGNKAKFVINYPLVIDNAFLLADGIIRDAHTRRVIFKNGNEFRRFLEIWENNQDKIAEYFNKLRESALNIEGSAVKKYNARVKN